MPQETPDIQTGNDSPETHPPAARLPAGSVQEGGQDGREQVPAEEAAKQGASPRRAAQQTEGQFREYEQKLQELRSQVERKTEQLAAAEAQRDEAMTRLTLTENRLEAQGLLSAAGVVDVEAATTLLAERLDLGDDLDRQAISGGVEKLLLDKPFLRRAHGVALPPATASARPSRTRSAGQLATAAERAARTGDRKDVAEYLRLRRQAATA